MTRRIDDETLVAYVDGELDEAEVRAVEAAIASDARLAQDARLLREGAAALRGAFAGPAHMAVPDRLLRVIEDAGGGERVAVAPRRARVSGVPAWASIAASLAVVVVGLGASFIYANRQVEQRLARLEAYRVEDQRLIERTLALALEKYTSGTPAQWSNPATSSSGEIKPVRTFRVASGQWCREYVSEARLRYDGEAYETHRAVACREADGTWKTRLVLTDRDKTGKREKPPPNGFKL
ncbi:MAG: RT0821/Lpp0805 family surface protein [Kiloniellaceae bacterium]